MTGQIVQPSKDLTGQHLFLTGHCALTAITCSPVYDLIVIEKSLVIPLIMTNNGSWTEQSAIWSETVCVISKSKENECKFKITSMILTKTALNSVQLPLYYICLETAQFNYLNTGL